MRTGAKITLLASFSHTSAEYIFSKLAHYIGSPIIADIEFQLTRVNGRLEVEAIDGVKIESVADGVRILNNIGFRSNSFAPISFIFGTNMNHQGALFIDENSFRLYEPYGTFKKKINGDLLDYYEHIYELLSGIGDTSTYSTGIQTTILRSCEAEYTHFYNDFINAIGNINYETASDLRSNLKKIDIGSQSSKLTYVVEIIEFFRDRCDELPVFLPLYEKYSPYSCVMMTALDVWGYFEGTTIKPTNNEELWTAIENMVFQISPTLAEFIEQTPECQMLRIKSLEI